MKILFVGDLREHTRSYQRYNAMQELGYNVTAVSFVPVDSKNPISEHTHVFARMCHKLGFPLDKTGVNHKILTHVQSRQVDIIWVEKGLMVRPSVLRKARKLQPDLLLISYTEDDMFARHNQSRYYKKSLPLYDVVFTTKSYNCHPEELPALGARKVVFVDKAYDKHRHRPVEYTQDDIRRLGSDVGFIGTFEQDRAGKMLYLAQNGVKVRIWGNGWSKWVGKHPNLQVENKPVYGEDYVKALCATKINLCFLRKMNRDLQTDRTMEIPACGAFMLGERTMEHQRLFDEGREAAFFESKEEMLQKIYYYLENEQERQEVSWRGKQRCLKSGYSHHDRLLFMLRSIEGEAMTAFYQIQYKDVSF